MGPNPSLERAPTGMPRWPRLSSNVRRYYPGYRLAAVK